MFWYTVLAAETSGIMLAGVALGIGVLAGLLLMAMVQLTKRQTVEKELAARKLASDAEAQKIIAQAEAQAKSEFISRREKFDADTETARRELRSEEKRLAKREDLIDQKLETVHSKEKMLAAADKAVHERENALADKDRHLNELIAQQNTQLMKVANLSADEAKGIVLSRVEKEMEYETGQLIERRMGEAKDKADVEARQIITSAIQRYAAEHTCDTTVSTVDIPSDEMKGRVIGREGRNIRAFEKATGVDVIVDDTPGVVVVSAFDPVRREVARRALERLILDGRIHPTRIEEVVAGTQKDVNQQIMEFGKQAVSDANVRGLNNKFIELLGRLHYRTSYGQNVLKHSLEVAYISQMIAEEMGLDGNLARRCGLLHDIGKAIDHEVEGGHPEIGANLCKRYGERDEVINAAAGHHGDVEARSLYTPIISAADAISAARHGARRDELEQDVQRLQKLEGIATGFEGVKQAFAVQAGREIRVIVDAAEVDDRLSAKIARDVAKRIEEEMEYPGEVRVTLVRELRCVEYAR